MRVIDEELREFSTRMTAEAMQHYGRAFDLVDAAHAEAARIVPAFPGYQRRAMASREAIVDRAMAEAGPDLRVGRTKQLRAFVAERGRFLVRPTGEMDDPDFIPSHGDLAVRALEADLVVRELPADLRPDATTATTGDRA